MWSGLNWKSQTLVWKKGWSLLRDLPFQSCSMPGGRNEASCSAVGIWGQGAEGAWQHWAPRRPLLAQPCKTSSLCLTPSHPISHHFPCLFIYCQMSLKSSHVCYFHFSIRLSLHSSKSFEIVLSRVFSHFLIARFSLFFIDVFETAEHSSSCWPLRHWHLLISSFFSDCSF